MEKDFDLLKNIIIDQARTFLIDAGEFYPFGATLNSTKEVKPLGVFLNDEYPDSSLVYSYLDKVINEGLKEKEYLLGAVGLDVVINGSEPALMVRIYDGNDFFDFYYLYFFENDSYSFYETRVS